MQHEGWPEAPIYAKPKLPNPLSAPTTLWGIFTASILLSQVISSVPINEGVGLGPGNVVAWVGLAATSTIAGNLTLIGAASYNTAGQ
ncbi:MAG: hypothetical protein RXN93_04365 [Thermocladium sp.]